MLIFIIIFLRESNIPKLIPNKEYVNLLEKIKDYYKQSTPLDNGNNRNSVDHGYMHPRFWTKESFETLIHDIAILSKYSKF